MSDLMTVEQATIYAAVRDLTNERGYPPTVREIAAAVGLASPSTVHVHLHNLADMGKVTWNKGQTRTLRIIG